MVTTGRQGRQRAGPANLQVPYLRHVQPVPAEREPVAGQPDRLPVILPGPEPRVPGLAALPLPGQRIKPVPVRAARVPARLHQCHRRNLTQPGPLRCLLGQRDDPALHLRVADLLPGRVARLPQPQAVVVDHPRAAEHPGQGLLLTRRRVDPVPVPDLHNTTACHWPLTLDDRRGRHAGPALHGNLVFVTKYRRCVPSADMLRCCEDAGRKVCGDFGASLPEFSGEE